MELTNVILLLLLVATAWQFWHIREMNELANRFAAHYCKKHALQLISVARESTRIRLFKGKPAWYCRFRFEFSANREALNSGTFEMHSKTVTAIDVPAYPIN
ncbi:DUF3301 domain-containing protein [Alteromonas oceanisediminis]|uniref:DUF3301 domain-containing protein n=1 Tax=Alteromonas oceanisediminis TaxID=2836180 RepID=UPI001BDB0D14|nr:DUF3301 domain-containing protein [Alteromonas oceanisediminis]MBT0585021.1 DUF3301 domain-containing protein [Alteromonas oceanisediminis]